MWDIEATQAVNIIQIKVPSSSQHASSAPHNILLADLQMAKAGRRAGRQHVAMPEPGSADANMDGSGSSAISSNNQPQVSFWLQVIGLAP